LKHEDEMLAAFFLHEGTKAQRHEDFY